MLWASHESTQQTQTEKCLFCLLMFGGEKWKCMFKFCVTSKTAKEKGNKFSYSDMNLWGGWVGKENWVRIKNNSPMLFHESEEEKSV